MPIFLLAAGALLGLGFGAAAWYATRPGYWYPYSAYPGYVQGYPGYYYAPVYYPARRVFYTWA